LSKLVDLRPGGFLDSISGMPRSSAGQLPAQPRYAATQLPVFVASWKPTADSYDVDQRPAHSEAM